jgi:hypothetical protein
LVPSWEKLENEPVSHGERSEWGSRLPPLTASR